MDIDKLKKLFAENKIKWSSHGLERMQERDISIDDVVNCVNTGEIIEEYIEDKPAISSVLIHGKNTNNKVLHIVVGLDDDLAYFVTAYYPSIEKFENDLKTRRK